MHKRGILSASCQSFVQDHLIMHDVPWTHLGYWTFLLYRKSDYFIGSVLLHFNWSLGISWRLASSACNRGCFWVVGMAWSFLQPCKVLVTSWWQWFFQILGWNDLSSLQIPDRYESTKLNVVCHVDSVETEGVGCWVNWEVMRSAEWDVGVESWAVSSSRGGVNHTPESKCSSMLKTLTVMSLHSIQNPFTPFYNTLYIYTLRVYVTIWPSLQIRSTLAPSNGASCFHHYSCNTAGNSHMIMCEFHRLLLPWMNLRMMATHRNRFPSPCRIQCISVVTSLSYLLLYSLISHT